MLSVCEGKKSQAKALNDFEMQMRGRVCEAVLLSRQACLDAHDFNALTDESPLLSKRAVVRSRAVVVAETSVAAENQAFAVHA